MTSTHEINRLLFCLDERQQLLNFKSYLNETEFPKLIKSCRFRVFKGWSEKEFTLTSIQKTALYNFLDEETKKLDSMLSKANEEDLEIAQAIFSGVIAKDKLKI